MILADTSVWIDYLRGTGSPAAGAFDDRLLAHDIVMCGPVATELLTGVDAGERARLWDAITGLAWIDLERAHWFVAGEVRAELRQRGVQVPFVDALIAAAAAGRAALWTLDRNFERIVDELEPLEVRVFES